MKMEFLDVTYSLRIGLVAAALIFLHHNARAQITPVNYGAASSFSILSGAGITFAATGPSTITGNIGLFADFNGSQREAAFEGLMVR